MVIKILLYFQNTRINLIMDPCYLENLTDSEVVN